MRSILLLLMLVAGSAHGEQQLNLAVHDQDIQVIRFSPPASQTGSQLMIWLMPRVSETPRLRPMAERMAQQGVEIWLVDLADSLFLPAGPTTQRNIHGRYVSGLIQAAHQQTGKTISLMARGYSAIPALRGARDWQQRQQQAEPQQNYLAGVVLLSPDVYATIPALGLEPVFEPISSATNVPIMLYQAGKRGNRWQLDKLLAQLRTGGSQVYVKILPGITGLLDEEDTTAVTRQAQVDFPRQLLQGLQLLQRTATPLKVAELNTVDTPGGAGLDTQLMPYRGRLAPLPLALTNAASGKRVEHKRGDYRGRVTVVNFWASWCGPCVQEIPSLNHLRQLMEDQPFELISINYAEEPQRIAAFMREVKVDFPVLLDEDGSFAAKWNVLVFPSTFVIGPDGNIAYGVNGAIHWDSAGVVQQLEALLP